MFLLFFALKFLGLQKYNFFLILKYSLKKNEKKRKSLKNSMKNTYFCALNGWKHLQSPTVIP